MAVRLDMGWPFTGRGEVKAERGPEYTIPNQRLRSHCSGFTNSLQNTNELKSLDLFRLEAGS
jgi:hypothetical protein